MSCRLLFLSLLLISFLGCSKEDVQEAINQRVEQADAIGSRVVERVQAEVGLSGNSQFSVDGETSTKQCFWEIIPTETSQANTLRIGSYNATVPESFPSYLFLAPCDVSSTVGLAGKSFQGTLFLQKESDGPLWYTGDGETVTLTISQVDGSAISATIDGASIACTSDNQAHNLSAKFRCVEVK